MANIYIFTFWAGDDCSQHFCSNPGLCLLSFVGSPSKQSFCFGRWSFLYGKTSWRSFHSGLHYESANNKEDQKFEYRFACLAFTLSIKPFPSLLVVTLHLEIFLPHHIIPLHRTQPRSRCSIQRSSSAPSRLLQAFGTSSRFASHSRRYQSLSTTT